MAWSSVDCSSHCLADRRRTEAFLEVLGRVSEGSVFLDAGAGSGVLAIGAARVGAGRVIAVERDEFICDLLRWTAAEQGLNIEVMCGDVRDVTLPRVDVVAAELVDVWLLEEDLISVFKSLWNRAIIDERTLVIPSGYTFHFELGWCDWNAFAGNLRWPFYEWPFYSGTDWSRPVFEPIVRCPDVAAISTKDVAVRDLVELRFDMAITRDVAENLITANAARLSGTLHLAPGVSLGECGSMNAPLVIPLSSYGGDAWEKGLSVYALLSGGLRSLRCRVGGLELLPWHLRGCR